MKLDRTSFRKSDVTRLAASGEARSDMLPQTGYYTRLAAMDQTRSHKLPQTGCDQVGSDACFSNRMLLRSERRQGWQRCFSTCLRGLSKSTGSRGASTSRRCHMAACRPYADLGVSGCDPPRSSSKLLKPAKSGYGNHVAGKNMLC